MARHLRRLSFLFILLVTANFAAPQQFPRGSRLLQFVKVVTSRATERYVDTPSSKAVEVDAGHKSQVTIVITEKGPFTIYCSIAKLSTVNSPYDWKLHRRADDGSNKQDSVEMVDKDWAFSQLEIRYSPQYNWLLKYNPDSKRRPTQSTESLSGSYACSVRTKFGTLQSNWFRIIDVREKRAEIHKSSYDGLRRTNGMAVTIGKPITSNQLPIAFDCFSNYQINAPGLYADRPQYGSPFAWTGCSPRTDSGVNSDQCKGTRINPDAHYAKPVDLKSHFDYTVLRNGTIILLKLLQPVTVSLVCSDTVKSNVVYNFYGDHLVNPDDKSMTDIRFIEDSSSSSPSPLLPLTDVNQNIVFSERKTSSPTFVYELLGVYKGPSDSTFEWKVNDKPVSKDFIASKYRLIFPKEVNTTHAGRYTLNVKAGGEELTFDFRVTVESTPYFTNAQDIPNETFIMGGQSVQLNYSISDGNVTNLLIDGYELKDPQMRSHVAKMNISYDSNTFSWYRADTTACDITDLEKCQSHTVTLVVDNKAGVAKAHTAIKVLPVPRPKDYPQKVSCNATLACREGQDLTLQCKFALDPYFEEDAVVRRLWFIDGAPIVKDNGAFYARVNSTDWSVEQENDNETLRLTNTSRSMSGAKVTCRLLLLYPEADKFVSRPLEDLLVERPDLVFFDSQSADYVDRELMSTVVMFIEPIKVANIGWIIALAVLLVLLIILIIIAIIYFKTRDPMQTYEPGKMEEGMGRNPKQELLEERFGGYAPGDSENKRLMNDNPDSPLAAGDPSNFAKREPHVIYRPTNSVATDSQI